MTNQIRSLVQTGLIGSMAAESGMENNLQQMWNAARGRPHALQSGWSMSATLLDMSGAASGQEIVCMPKGMHKAQGRQMAQ